MKSKNKNNEKLGKHFYTKEMLDGKLLISVERLTGEKPQRTSFSPPLKFLSIDEETERSIRQETVLLRLYAYRDFVKELGVRAAYLYPILKTLNKIEVVPLWIESNGEIHEMNREDANYYKKFGVLK